MIDTETKDRFECPVCRAAGYEQLVVNRPDGDCCPICFYRCIKCGFAFSDVLLHVRRRQHAGQALAARP